MEKGQTAVVKAKALLALTQAGYTHDSTVAYVGSMDPSKLQQNMAAVAPPGQPVQHMLPQAQPGATASPLPPANPRLPLSSTSPGAGGNNTPPIPRPSPARRGGEAAREGSLR